MKNKQEVDKKVDNVRIISLALMDFAGVNGWKKEEFVGACSLITASTFAQLNHDSRDDLLKKFNKLVIENDEN